MRRFLVSAFLAEMTQQIHSFRASGVMAAQRFFAAASEAMALRKSAGSLWTRPPAFFLVVILRMSSQASHASAGAGDSTIKSVRQRSSRRFISART